MYKDLLETDHRPFAMPTQPWVMTQTWDDLLFMHWRIPANELSAQIPDMFEVDTWEGSAWLALVPFEMNHIRAKGLPPLPLANSFLELNVRTYVTYKGMPGVYFFSLDANHRLAVTAARKLFSLPYMNAKMTASRKDGGTEYRSERKHPGEPNARFHVRYRPTSPPFYSEPGSLEEWLTERYLLWTSKGKKVFRGDIHHRKWELQQAEAVNFNLSMIPFLPPELFSDSPHLLYAKSLRAFIWPMQFIP